MSLYSLLGDLILFSVWLSFCIATYIFIKIKTGVCFKLLYSILLLTVITESSGSILGFLNRMKFIDFANNIIVYNIYEFIVFPLLFFLYFKLIRTNKRKLIPIFLFAFFITSIVEGIYFIDYTSEYERFPFIIGAIGLSFSTVFYFTQILEDGSFELIRNNFFFWLSCGTLVYYVGSVPFVSVINIFAFERITEQTFFNIVKVLAVIMYAFISIGLFRYKISDE